MPFLRDLSVFRNSHFMDKKVRSATCRSLGTRFFYFYGGKDSIPRVMLITPEPGIK